MERGAGQIGSDRPEADQQPANRHEPEVRDPVCGMKVAEEGALRHSHAGTVYLFCSTGCQKKFATDPERYLSVGAPPGEKEKPAAPGKVYTCPMHPEVRQLGPGICPICGMALEPELPSADSEPDPEYIDLRRRFWIGLVFSLPLVLLAMGEHLVAGVARIPFLGWIQGLLATPVVLWAGAPFFERGWRGIVTGRLNMFSLIALGVAAAYLYSLAALFFPDFFPPAFRTASGQVPLYFEAAAAILSLTLLGQVLELRARAQTGGAIRTLLGRSPKQARRTGPEGDQEIPVSEVMVGDRLRVRPGEAVPVDGTIEEGSSSLDEALVTGESLPVEKGSGDKVIAGTLNRHGSFVFRAEQVGSDTVLAKIVSMVAEAQRSRAPIQRLADLVASWFVPGVVVIALLAFLAWSFWGPPPALVHALLASISVLVIACPCALGLATPLSITVGVGQGALHGVLLRNAEALESMEKVDTLVVDKTGTLTEGHPKVVGIQTLPGIEEEDLLRLAAGLERGSEHPLAGALVAAAEERGLGLPASDHFLTLPGKGVEGRIEGRNLLLGNARLMTERKIDLALLTEAAERQRREGATVLFAAIEGKAAGTLAVADPIKAETPAALKVLRREGLRIVMLTGDNRTTAEAVAKKLGIEEIEAEVLPEQKHEVVRRLRREGRIVAMVGDGINDAPALAAADVGIAMGTGTDVAIQSAGITLMRGDLRGLVQARRLSHATLSNIRQNLVLAFAYNALGVPLAAGVLYPFTGLLLSPIVAALAMALSSLSVVGNALRLRGRSLGEMASVS